MQLSGSLLALVLASLVAGCGASERSPRAACNVSSAPRSAPAAKTTSDSEIVCTPPDAPAPPGADDACRGKTVGEACTVSFGGIPMDGTCG